MNKLWWFLLMLPSLAMAQVNGSFNNLTAKTVNGRLNAARYCNAPGVLDQSCLANAVAASGSASIYLPAGTYTGTSLTITQSNVNLILDPAASLNFSLIFQGPGYNRSHTLVASGTYGVGVSSFSGNFSAYSTCSTVIVEQTTSTSGNQIGSEFFPVASASGTALTISGVTRYGYLNPTLSCVSGAVRYTGTVASGATSIPGDYTATLSAGDYVRVDNVAGVDSPTGINSYFEIAKVLSVSPSSTILEAQLHSQFVNPWIVKMSMITGDTIRGGGYIQSLQMWYSVNSIVDALRFEDFNSLYLYNFIHSNLIGDAAGAYPVAYGVTFAWHGSVSNISTFGGASSTDNANFKAAQVQDVAFSNVSTWNDVPSAQGAYGAMWDFSFTPYSIWNANDTITGVTQNVSPFSIYLGGLKNSAVSAVSSMGGIVLIAGSQVELSAISSQNALTIRSGDNYHVSALSANAISVGDDGPVTNSNIGQFHIGDCTRAVIPNRCVWIRGASNNISFAHGNFAPSGNDQSFYVNDPGETLMFFDDITDSPGAGASVVSSGATIYVGANRFTGSVQGPIAGPVDIYWTDTGCTTGVGQPIHCVAFTSLPLPMRDANYQIFCTADAGSQVADFACTPHATPLPTTAGAAINYNIVQLMQNGGGGGTPTVYFHAHHN